MRKKEEEEEGGIEEDQGGCYGVIAEDSMYLVDREVGADDGMGLAYLLNCKYAHQSLFQYLELNQKHMKTRIFDARFPSDGRPCDQLRDICNGILRIVLTLDWTRYSYRKLGNPKAYGLEWVDSFYQTEWEPMILVHLPLGSFKSSDASPETVRMRKQKVLCLFDKIFFKSTNPDGTPRSTNEYPPFFRHWHSMMVEWVNDQNYPHSKVLMNHPTFWPWRNRLEYFQSVQKFYDNPDGTTKSLVDDAVRGVEQTLDTPWQLMLKDSPFGRIYAKPKHQKPNLYLFLQCSLRHLHGRRDEKVASPMIRQSYKYITFDEMNTFLKPLKVEEYITAKFPTLLPILATTLITNDIPA